MSGKTAAVKKPPGIGTVPTTRGVTFRVWAPHAEKVYVTGTFNDWSKTSTPLAKPDLGTVSGGNTEQSSLSKTAVIYSSRTRCDEGR